MTIEQLEQLYGPEHTALLKQMEEQGLIERTPNDDGWRLTNFGKNVTEFAKERGFVPSQSGEVQ